LIPHKLEVSIVFWQSGNLNNSFLMMIFSPYYSCLYNCDWGCDVGVGHKF